MQTAKHATLHKAFSAFVAFALAALMVPIVPGSTPAAAAADGTTTGYPVSDIDANGFITKLVVDQYADATDSATQVIDEDALAKAAIDAKQLSVPDMSNDTDNASVKEKILAYVKTADKDAFAALANSKVEEAAKADALGKVTDAELGAWVASNGGDDKLKAELPSEATDVDASGAITYGTSGATMTVTGASVTENTAEITDITLKDGSVSFKADNPAMTNVTATNNATPAIGLEIATDKKSFTMTPKAAGTPKLNLEFTYDKVAISSYEYTYKGTYTYGYSGYTYSGWSYSKTFKYKLDDEEKEQTVTLTGGDITSTESRSTVSGTAETTEFSKASNRDIDTGTVSTSTTCTYAYDMAVVNLFPEPAAEKDLGTVGFGGSENVDLFENVEFNHNLADEARAKLGSPTVVATGGSDLHFTADKNGDGVAKLTAKLQGTDIEETVRWSYGNYHDFDRKVKGTVEPGVIDLAEFDFSDDVSTFRLQGDIEQRALDELNAEILRQANAANEAAGVEPVSSGDVYYDSASLTDFKADGLVAQNAGISLTTSSTTSYGNFVVKNEPDKLKVNAMVVIEDWPGDLVLAAGDVKLNGANVKEKWVNVAPTATYAGHSLAYQATSAPSTAEGYKDAVDMDRGDGIHTLELFALAKDDHEITRIKNVSYMLDTQAPILLSAEYSTPQGGSKIDTGTTLFGKDTVKVDLGINDRPKGNTSESHDPLDATASGLEGQPKVKYIDKEANANGAERSPSLSQTGVVYSFSLAGNEDVLTDSIKVYAIDKAGNELNWKSATEAENIPVEILQLVADADKPQIEVTWNNNDVRNGRYYDDNRVMTITITEKFFDYVRKYQESQEIGSITATDGTAVVIHPTDFNETADNSNVWTYTYTFSTDTDWTVSAMQVVDLVGNSDSAAGDSFTIDKTSPSMDVVFDNNNASNGNYYNAARTATITVTEHNFDSSLVNIEPTANAGNGDSVGSPDVSSWTNDGDVHTATVNFPGEGVYTLTVSGTDLANRALPTHETSEFIIDTTAPQIQISGVDNRQAYSGSAQPSVMVQDTNISDATTIEVDKRSHPMRADDANPYSESRSNATTEITASYPDASRIASNDGVYTLTVHAVDMAGNTADQAVTWSVNRFGSTYVLSDDTTKMLNSYLKDSKVSDVVVTEINPSGLNESATAVELTHDTTNSTLKRGSDYGVSESDASGWNEYTYDVQKSNFGADGSYRVLLHSEDVASNTSENTMTNKNVARTEAVEVAFAVDNTAPIVSFIDLATNGLYEESTHTAQVSIEDNLKLDSAEVTVDGKPATLNGQEVVLDAAALSGSATHSFDVPESAATHEIVVTAYDAAGNAETVTATNVTVTTDPVKLWMNNTPLFVGTIVGGIVVIGAAAAFIVMRARRPKL